MLATKTAGALLVLALFACALAPASANESYYSEIDPEVDLDLDSDDDDEAVDFDVDEDDEDFDVPEDEDEDEDESEDEDEDDDLDEDDDREIHIHFQVAQKPKAKKHLGTGSVFKKTKLAKKALEPTSYLKQFQGRVKKIVKRLRKERTALMAKDKKFSKAIAALQAKIAASEARIRAVLAAAKKNKVSHKAALHAKYLKEKMAAHPVMRKISEAIRFVKQLKQMVKSLKKVSVDSPAYAVKMGKIAGGMKKLKKLGVKSEDLDLLANIDESEERVTDDDVSSLTEVLDNMMRHLQANKAKLAAKIKADHDKARAVHMRKHKAALASLADAKKKLADWKRTFGKKHAQIKKEIMRINSELYKLGAISGKAQSYKSRKGAHSLGTVGGIIKASKKLASKIGEEYLDAFDEFEE